VTPVTLVTLFQNQIRTIGDCNLYTIVCSQKVSLMSLIVPNWFSLFGNHTVTFWKIENQMSLFFEKIGLISKKSFEVKMSPIGGFS
jgi:hypothetical protein